jgi:hypothetical protein
MIGKIISCYFAVERLPGRGMGTAHRPVDLPKR